MGAGDRKTALRWMIDSEEDYCDSGYMEYSHGLPYGYIEKEFV
jgi:hypothetical protein